MTRLLVCTTGGRRAVAMELLHQQGAHTIYHGDSLNAGLPAMADAIITDTPFSARCHAGHNAGRSGDGVNRRSIDYPPWGEREVFVAVDTWAAFCRGWMAILTDHVLAPIWQDAFRRAGMYAFAPVPAVCPGSRVRLTGDGPPCVSWWVVPARPRRAPYFKWNRFHGPVRGYYLVKPERPLAMPGGKPLELMRQLVADYSMPGDLVADPCCGAGTTGMAAAELGRSSVQIDCRRIACRKAIKRLDAAVREAA